MNILVLCLSPGYGGLELYALHEIEQLERRGHVCVPVVSCDSMLFSRLKAATHNYHVLRTSIQSLPLIAAKRLAKLIEKENISVIHIHWARDLNLAALAKYFSKRKVKLVYSRHMGITRSKRDLLHNWFYSMVDVFIANTRVVEEEAQRFLPLPAERIARLYIGVAEPDANKKDCDIFFENQNFYRRKLNLALFGRIEHGKGQHVLLIALQKLVQQGMDVSATLIGHVMDQAYHAKLLIKIETEKLEKHVQFMGFVEQPANQMGCFDLVVLTTYCETFGLVLVEAMRAGVAVIGTDAGGVPEIIKNEESGLLVPAGNAEALVAAIVKLYNNEELKNRLAIAGKSKADEKFNGELHFNTLEQMLMTKER